jgi:hypothetical protein
MRLAQRARFVACRRHVASRHRLHLDRRRHRLGARTGVRGYRELREQHAHEGEECREGSQPAGGLHTFS